MLLCYDSTQPGQNKQKLWINMEESNEGIMIMIHSYWYYILKCQKLCLLEKMARKSHRKDVITEKRDKTPINTASLLSNDEALYLLGLPQSDVFISLILVIHLISIYLKLGHFNRTCINQSKLSIRSNRHGSH